MKGGVVKNMGAHVRQDGLGLGDVKREGRGALYTTVGIRFFKSVDLIIAFANEASEPFQQG